MKKILKTFFVIAVFCLTFLMGTYFLKTKNSDTSDIQVFLNNIPTTNERIDVLRKEFDNEDIKAIISSKLIGLDAIVVQSSDNIYYMDHNINKKYNRVGSIFIDYRNDFNSKKIIIYGHNSKDLETDFGKLATYLDLEFTKKNPYIELITNENITKWEIFSVMVVPNSTTAHTRIEFSSVKQLKEHLDWMKNNSKIQLEVEVDINDQLMTLQTCYYEPEDSFLLINLKKVEDNNE